MRRQDKPDYSHVRGLVDGVAAYAWTDTLTTPELEEWARVLERPTDELHWLRRTMILGVVKDVIETRANNERRRQLILDAWTWAAEHDWPRVIPRQVDPRTKLDRPWDAGALGPGVEAWEQQLHSLYDWQLEILVAWLRQEPTLATTLDSVPMPATVSAPANATPDAWRHVIRGLSREESYQRCLEVRQRIENRESLRKIARLYGKSVSTIKTWGEDWLDELEE